MARRPTIVEVAAQAGVSKATVSLVLRGSPLVRVETAMLVRRAMADLGYVYNRAAAGLRRSGGGLIGLVINDLRNPFFTEFATSLQMALAARGHATVIANAAEDAALQDRLIRSMIEHGVAGLVISPVYGEVTASFDQIRRAGLPALQVLRRADPRGDLFPFASFDYAEGGRLATRHLREAGARRIAFCGGVAARPITAERMSGYLAEVETPRVLTGPTTRAQGMAAAAQLQQADAVLCFNDVVALGLMAGFARLGRMPGRDVRVVGFDDIEEAAQAWPPLSSVRCDIARFGAETAGTLLDWLGGGRQPPPERRAEVALVTRASSMGGGA